jgi:hypothetical protein
VAPSQVSSALEADALDLETGAPPASWHEADLGAFGHRRVEQIGR